MQERYHQALTYELETIFERKRDLSISVVYIKMFNGCYPDHLLLDIAGTLRSIVGLEYCDELTLEIAAKMPRANDVDCWKEAGVTRINIHERLDNDLDSFISCVKQISHFFNNVALDICLRDPLDLIRLNDMVDQLISLPIGQIALELADSLGERTIDYFKFFKAKLCSAGFEQYELFNFARKGFQSQYMHHVWDQKPTIGLGAGAQSCFGRFQYENEPDGTRYVNALAHRGTAKKYVERISSMQYAFQKVMLNLRRKRGFVIKQALRSLPGDDKEYFLKTIHLLSAAGLLRCVKEHCALTSKGQLYEQEIVKKLVYNN